MAAQLLDDFKCPISLEIMSDPVILSLGHTFDRSLISNFILISSFLTWARKGDSAIRCRLAESGAVSAILNCVGYGEPGIQEKALHFLLNLSMDDDNKVGLVAEGVVGKVVYALHCGVGDSRTVATTVLTSLAVLEVNKVTIGSCPDAIPGLVSLLQMGNLRERKEAYLA